MSIGSLVMCFWFSRGAVGGCFTLKVRNLQLFSRILFGMECFEQSQLEPNGSETASAGSAIPQADGIDKNLEQLIFDENGEPIMDCDEATDKVMSEDVTKEEEEEVEGEEEEKEEEGENKKEDDSEELDEDEYEVEQVLDVAAMDGEIKYLVRWKEYGSEEDSWEPERNLETARLILDEYIASHQDKVKKYQKLLDARKKKRNHGRSRHKRDNKAKKASQRSSSSDASETGKISKTRTKRMKVVADDGLKGNDDGSANEDHGAKSASKQKRKLRSDKSEMKKDTTVHPSTDEKKALPKELTPKNAKNAWLYDDREDADSDASERSGMKKNVGKEPMAVENGRPKKNAMEKKVKAEPRASAEEQFDSDSEAAKDSKTEKTKKAVGTGKATTRSKGKQQLISAGKKENELELPEPKAEFMGIVKCHDGAVKVVYSKMGECKPHVVSVREAFELDGYGLVQYLISRCEFGEPSGKA